MSPKVLATILMTAIPLTGFAALPPLNSVVDLLRTNLSVEAPTFDHEAGTALIEKFGGRIIGPDEPSETPSDAPPIVRKERFDNGALYVLVGQVSPGLAPQLKAALLDTNWTAGAAGMVIDLRFAVGNEFDAAGRAAALFADRDGEVLSWGDGSVRVTGPEPAWKQPVAVLVNGSTKGAAEAFAAALRTEAGALLIGRASAGRAAVFRDLPLDNGSKLRLPVARVRTGDGKEISASGLQPDITVNVSPEQDRAYLADPYTLVSSSGQTLSSTNGSASTLIVRRRVNEAELVRAQREGTVPGDTRADTAADAVRIVRDPVLGRGLDLVRGLSILQKR